ncbi:hypothetical protein FCM35_KLT03368 [Carex littledalei]|uniref:Uncharacterized protein n=1 Tax=Carex littledalei TaxID=544730 RepID=A0A833VB75_9POAL|nr:hypothetical protein FCM35_KLT03368 [Carex littledalei]
MATNKFLFGLLLLLILVEIVAGSAITVAVSQGGRRCALGLATHVVRGANAYRAVQAVTKRSALVMLT